MRLLCQPQGWEVFVNISQSNAMSIFSLNFMDMSVLLHLCLCIMCLPGALGFQQRVLDSLELVLQMIVSQHMGTGR